MQENLCLRACAALVLALSCCTCARGPSERELEPVPVRPLGPQIVFSGGLLLGRDMNDILRQKGRKNRREALRRPLWGLYELLKGPDLLRHVTATIAVVEGKLGGPRGANPRLAELVRLAGIDVADLATRTLSHAPEEDRAATRAALEERGVQVIDGDLSPIRLELGGTRVALLAHADSSEPNLVRRVQAAARAARMSADLVVLALAWDPEQPPSLRVRIARELVDRAGVDLLLGHHPGAFEGIERRDRGLIVYNPGPALAARGQAGGSLVVRLHLEQARLRWVEAQPIRLTDRSSRIGMGREETYGVIDRLVELSSQQGTEVKNEFGRGMIDLERPQRKAGR